MKKTVPRLSRLLLILILMSLFDVGVINDLDMTDRADASGEFCYHAPVGVHANNSFDCITQGGQWGVPEPVVYEPCPSGTTEDWSNGYQRCVGGPSDPTPTPTPPIEVRCSSSQDKVGTGASAYCVDKPRPKCPAGTTPVGYVPTGYCQKTSTVYVDKTEMRYNKNAPVSSVEEIIKSLDGGTGKYGNYGERNEDNLTKKGTDHYNGWSSDGSGDGKVNNFVSVTNIPDNGLVSAMGDYWIPSITISQGKINLSVPKPTSTSTAESNNWESNFNYYKTSLSETEIVVYEVKDMSELQTLQESSEGLTSLFKKDSTGGYINSASYSTINKDGVSDLNKLKVKTSGYYLVGTKYVDRASAKQKYGDATTAEQLKAFTSYTFTPINLSFTSDSGYLPIYNNLLAEVNEGMLLMGVSKVNHKLANLRYGSYKSMKVPSAYNHKNNLTVIASTSGGIQLIDGKMKPVAIIDKTGGLLATCKVNSIVESVGVFYIATNSGVLLLDGENMELSNTTINTPTYDLELHNNILYLIADNNLLQYFIEGPNLIKSNRKFDLATLFKNPANEGGRIEMVGDLLTVSSKDTGSGSEVIVLSNI